jgi:membrane-associated phospholipid phosphatase
MLQRMRYLLWLKLLGVSGFMWLFFIGYFYLLRNPARPVMEMPLTALDLAISHQPSAFAAYVSLWLYVGIAPGLMPRLRDLVVYGLWAAALCASGLLVFYLAPTAVPPPVVTADLSQHAGFALLKGVDAAGNACPSLHVATALFSAVWIGRLLRHIGAPGWLRAANWVWLLAIVYSTLAIKQHVVLDAVAGAALGSVFAWASLRWLAPQAGLRGA